MLNHCNIYEWKAKIGIYPFFLAQIFKQRIVLLLLICVCNLIFASPGWPNRIFAGSLSKLKINLSYHLLWDTLYYYYFLMIKSPSFPICIVSIISNLYVWAQQMAAKNPSHPQHFAPSAPLLATAPLHSWIMPQTQRLADLTQTMKTQNKSI